MNLAGMTQSGRKIQITPPTLTNDPDLLVTEVTFIEEISRPFSCKIKIAAAAPDLDPAELVGKTVALELELASGGPRAFHGYVRRMRQPRTVLDDSRYVLDVVPWTWLLTRTAGCRAFTNKTAVEIVKAILDAHGISDYDDSKIANTTYPQRKLCIQYRESDFDFVSRLLEEEGIFYFFTHTDASHTLVFGNDAAHHPDHADPAVIQYLAGGPGNPGDEVAHSAVWKQSQRSTKVTLRDFNYELSTDNMTGEHGTDGFEIYDYPGGFRAQADGTTYATTRLQAEQASGVVITGGSNIRTLASGHRGDLDNHARLNQAVLIQKVTHTIEEGINSGFAYTNTFVFSPHATPFRPARRTPVPSLEGPQTATVVGATGEEAHTDSYGRVPIRFHWERVSSASPKPIWDPETRDPFWCRVSQARAGANWGDVVLPYTGQEVVVSFLEGRPDAPLVTGRVYNNAHMPPRALPDDQLVTVLRDKPGNELRFDATPGAEHMRLYSPNGTSTIEIGPKDTDSQGIFYKTDKNRGTYTLGNTSDVRLGTDQKFTAGSSHSQFIGLKTDVFVGASAAFWGGAAITLKTGFTLDLAATGTASFSAGFGYDHYKGTKVSKGDSAFTTIVEDDLTMDSNATVRVVGGESDNSILKGADKELVLSYGEGSGLSATAAPTGTMLKAGAAGFTAAIAAGMVGMLAGQAKGQRLAEDDTRTDLTSAEQDERQAHRDKNFSALVLGSIALGLGGLAAAAGAAKLARKAYKTTKEAADSKKQHAYDQKKVFGKLTLDADGVKVAALDGTAEKSFVHVKKDGTIVIEGKGDVTIETKEAKSVEIKSDQAITINAKARINLIAKSTMKVSAKGLKFL